MTEPEPAYTATDLFSEFSGRWRIYWETYLDGRFLTADDRSDPLVTFARRTPEELRDCLREWEAGQAAKARL